MLGISVDGAAPIHTVTRRIGDDTDDDVGNASGSGIITLGAESSQDLKLYVKNPASAEIFIVKHAQVVMTQLKQAELGTFGEMYYSAGTTHQNKPSGQVISTSFTKLTDFNSPGNLKNVTYSSNALTVGSDGNYLVCLTMSF